MRISRIDIKNFRSIREMSLEVGGVTRIIGANGSGKSTILRALEIFYRGGTPDLTSQDCFHGDISQPIEVALTFRDLSIREFEEFNSRVTNDGELSIGRVIRFDGGRPQAKYHGRTWLNPHFQSARAQTKASEKLRAYRELVKEQYPGLISGPNSADGVEKAFAAWEEANPQACQWLPDDGQFFGFPSVAQGKLNMATQLVSIPAVRDAAIDAAEGRGSPIAELMDIIVRRAIEARPEIQKLKEHVREVIEKETNPANVPELAALEDTLTTELKRFYPECAVLLDWMAVEPIKPPMPGVFVQLDDDGVATPVDRTGHGLQRSFIMALLQRLASAEANQKSEEGLPGTSDDQFPSLVLAIEEPELFQHPTKQRHVSRVLTNLADGKVQGSRATQIIYCTHSGLFVDIERFDEVRLIRRQRPGADLPREARLSSLSFDSVAQRLEAAWKKPPGTFTATSLRPRLHVINPSVAEGFFARAVVLVEGASDRAAILAAAEVEMKTVELGALDVAVLDVGGKGNIDKTVEVFRGFDIPVYAIWDCDEGGKNPNKKGTQALQRLMGVAEEDVEDFCERVTAKYACFRKTLEATLKADLGADLYSALVQGLREEFEITTDDVIKTPAHMRELLIRADKQNVRSATLRRIVKAILTLVHAATASEPA